jgi:hypothetical protein
MKSRILIFSSFAITKERRKSIFHNENRRKRWMQMREIFQQQQLFNKKFAI